VGDFQDQLADPQELARTIGFQGISPHANVGISGNLDGDAEPKVVAGSSDAKIKRVRILITEEGYLVLRHPVHEKATYSATTALGQT
jgi:hypothetical protein